MRSFGQQSCRVLRHRGIGPRQPSIQRRRVTFDAVHHAFKLDGAREEPVEDLWIVGRGMAEVDHTGFPRMPGSTTQEHIGHRDHLIENLLTPELRQYGNFYESCSGVIPNTEFEYIVQLPAMLNRCVEDIPKRSKLPKQQRERSQAFEGATFGHEKPKALATREPRRFFEQLDSARCRKTQFRIIEKGGTDLDPIEHCKRVEPEKLGDFNVACQCNSTNL